MKPTKFSYHRPKTLEEAMQLLSTYPDEAKVIAGGQSLVPLMNMRLARPGHLVDINDLADLAYIRKDGDVLCIGALTRQAELERSGLVKEHCPIVADAVRHIGHYAIRQRGTIGGSLVHADPSAELPLMATLFNAQLGIASSTGMRTALAEDFFLSIYTTDIMPDEILTEITFPLMRSDEGWSYQEFSRRAGDFAIVSAATVLRLDGDGRLADLRMALGGAEFTPLNVSPLISDYLGETPSESWMRAVTDAVTRDLDLGSDLHATAEDRRDWLKLMVHRSLAESLERLTIGGFAK